MSTFDWVVKTYFDYRTADSLEGHVNDQIYIDIL